MAQASPAMEQYFQEIETKLQNAYATATEARKKGFDPEEKVEIFLARNMAERVEGLISTVAPQIKGSGIVPRLFELEKNFGTGDWRVALTIAEEIATEKFCKFKSQLEAMEIGIRVGLAYITVGVVSSPIEGFTHLELKKTNTGDDYLAVFYSGPIRSAGGTAAAVSLLIADYLRTKMSLAKYDPTEQEVKRAVTEIEDYHERVTNLQYFPSKEEIIFLASRLPIQIDGSPSEKTEVSNYKDVSRIATNRIRNGFCLVFAEALAQKAKKLWAQLSKWGPSFSLDNWEFLNEFLELQKRIKSKGKSDLELAPDYTYIKDIVGGRPIISHPSRRGGFRLRYGRTRMSGLSSIAIHPATRMVLDKFIATGTQLKMERPGKSAAVTPCDSIEGPIVKLINNSVLQLQTEEEAKKYQYEISEILFLGDILISYGDFYNRAHKLVPCGYCEEWYFLDLEKALNENQEAVQNTELNELALKFQLATPNGFYKPTIEEALFLSEKLNIALHPNYTYFWSELDKKQLVTLLYYLKEATFILDQKNPQNSELILPQKEEKRLLELIGLPHTATPDHVVISYPHSFALFFNLGVSLINKDSIESKLKAVGEEKEDSILKLINQLSRFKIKDKSGTFIGARMGRPEKAKLRALVGSPNVLFPVGSQGGRLRSVQSALESSIITAQFPIFLCLTCGLETIYPVCEICSGKTQKTLYCDYCKLVKDCPHNPKGYKEKSIDIKTLFFNTLKKLQFKEPPLIKGVRGTSNKDHTPENLSKGILRAHYGLTVNKDGTIRYDMTELVITHFTPKEISTSIEKLREMGYTKDIKGGELVNDLQLLELKPQDIILPTTTSFNNGAEDMLFKTANFLDSLLKKFYSMPPFYNLAAPQDLVGHLVIGLSPHTSAGITARIIGFSQVQALVAHPSFHSIMRRDADGDEACVILLLDALLNFSRHFLPANRGATQDAPLILTSRLIITEVDDMVFDMDICSSYPLEVYESSLIFEDPRKIKLDQLKKYLNTERQYEGFSFTHHLSNINIGTTHSAYKSIPTMDEKIKKQLRLAEKIRAVDAHDVARLVLDRHLIRDIKGNLRKFSTQQFRCTKCNAKYRRPPLIGKCRCNGNLVFTISEGSILKYLSISLDLIKRYAVPNYLKQTVLLTQNRIESVFGKDKEKQGALGDFA